MKKILFTLFFIPSLSFANSEQEEASRAIILAMYKQSGMESNVNDFIKYQQEKYVPKEYKPVVDRFTLVVHTIFTQRISAEWTF